MEFQSEPRRLFPPETRSPSSRDSSPDREASPEVDSVYRVCCTCKSTCQRRKCPCKEVGLFCGDHCKCGTKRNPCKNQRPAEEPEVTPESERTLRVQTIQEYATSLTTEQCHKLIVEAYSDIGGIELAKALLANNSDQLPLQNNGPSQSQNLTPWCVCRKCHVMDSAEENKCCRQRDCVTNSSAFDSLVLNREALNIAIVHRSDFFVSTPDYTPQSYRKAAYQQFVIWKYGHLGSRNRRVVPSCVIWAIRYKYPAPDGNYLGYKDM